MTITVTNAEVAAELEALAQAYEDTVQKLRYEADRLRQGFQLTLNVSATQVHLAKPTPDRDEELFSGPEEEETLARLRREAEKQRRANERMEHDDPRHADEQDPNRRDQQRPLDSLPEEAIKLIDEMTSPSDTMDKEEEEE
ncbi:MAG: hypothetical protein RR853_08905 [Aurantimicrobium sp.]